MLGVVLSGDQMLFGMVLIRTDTTLVYGQVEKWCFITVSRVQYGIFPKCYAKLDCFTIDNFKYQRTKKYWWYGIYVNQITDVHIISFLATGP